MPDTNAAMTRAKNANMYFNDKYPWDAAEWTAACSTAIANKDREAALTCLEMWDGTTNSHTPTSVLLTAMKQSQMSIVKKIIRRMPFQDMALWHELITCAVLDCRSTALLHFLKIEFLSTLHDEDNPLGRWDREIKNTARMIASDAVKQRDCLAVRICLRIEPLLAPDPSVIVKHNTSPDMLWIILSRMFEVPEGGLPEWDVASWERSLQFLKRVSSTKSLRSPATRAMARLFLKRGLAILPSLSQPATPLDWFNLQKRNSIDFRE